MLVKDIKLNPSNPRIIKDDKFKKLVKSLKEFPEMAKVRPVVIDEDNMILGGNMRFKAMLEAGWTDIPVTKVKGWTEEQKREFVVKDNLGYGEWDYDVLANDYDLEQLDEWGMDIADDLLPQKEIEEDEAPEVDQGEPISKLGKVYQLGRHRLMCGDSTSIESVEKLMDGNKADIGFTSPPYNAGQTPTEVKMGKDSKYLNDNDDKEDEEYFELLVKSTDLSNRFTKYNFVNLQMLSGNKIPLLDFVYNYKYQLADIIIWNKLMAQPAMAENVLNSQFEFVFVLSEKGNRHIGTKTFRGTLSNIVDISKQNKNKIKEHNATFPVEFAGYFVKNFSNESVFDLFGGSGSTLIACEQIDRTCYMMELDPKYCDVIRKRYWKFTTGSEEGWEESTQSINVE